MPFPTSYVLTRERDKSVLLGFTLNSHRHQPLPSSHSKITCYYIKRYLHENDTRKVFLIRAADF